MQPLKVCSCEMPRKKKNKKKRHDKSRRSKSPRRNEKSSRTEDYVIVEEDNDQGGMEPSDPPIFQAQHMTDMHELDMSVSTPSRELGSMSSVTIKFEGIK